MRPNTCATLPGQGMLFAPPITPANVLTLPRLADGVPLSFQLGGDHAKPCKLAKALAIEGVMRPSQWGSDVVDSCIKSITEWTGWFKAFKMDLTVTFDLGDAHLEDYGPGPRGGFILCHDQPPDGNVFTLKRRVMALEKKYPGAGQAVMSALQYADIPIYKPFDAFIDCCFFHWRGESDEERWAKLAAEEDGEPPGDPAVRVRDWVQEMPRWAYKPRPIGRDTLKAFARKLPKVFDPLIAIRDFEPGVNERRQIRNTMGTTSPCILEWKPYGLVSRLYDDVVNEVVQGGDDTQLDVMAVLCFTDSVESVRAATSKLNRLLNHITVIREAIEQIADHRKDE